MSSERVTNKRLIAFSNDTFYNEDIMAAGEMVALAASANDIDTTDQLMAFEAFQKVCVVNGANLKIADFSNSLVEYSTGLTTAPRRGDTLVQATSNASMIVDYVSEDKKKIYGFRITDEVFVTTGGYTVTSDDVAGVAMDPAAFQPSAVTDRSAGPLWYDWLTHEHLTEDMPAKVYLGCKYRGRAVLSGNPNAPFQWYMSRQGDIHDFDYVAGDAQTPVKGGNSNMGEIGDIITALISFKDDFLIFGCATSIWYAADDPAYGGTLNSLDLTTGIYGPFSWCVGPTGETGNSTLFFWGTNGLYMTSIPGVPVCISELRLPDLVEDESADNSTHRITMSYDRLNNGVNIFIVKTSDGTNSNWWYDLRTQGFFPETYPEEAAAYSSFYYAAADTDNRGVLVGGQDGYIRTFDRSAKSDDAGASDEAIDSYVALEPYPMGKDLDHTGKLTAFNLMSSGGRSGGSQSDSSDTYFKVYAELTPEGVMEKIIADGIPNVGGTFTAPGRRTNNRRMQKIDGSYLGIKLGNNTIAESWSFEKFYGTIMPSGRIK